MSQAVATTERRQLWSWVWSRVRPWVGWSLALLGGVALFLGWYGVSGEALTAKQVPYLVSGGLTGIGLIILAGVFLATDDVRRQLAKVEELERKVDELRALFVVELTEPAAVDGGSTTGPAAATDSWVALPNGVSFHRAGCALVTGKAEARPVDDAVVQRRGLRPCRVCDPRPQT
jgi:hypothetical protein